MEKYIRWTMAYALLAGFTSIFLYPTAIYTHNWTILNMKKGVFIWAGQVYFYDKDGMSKNDSINATLEENDQSNEESEYECTRVEFFVNGIALVNDEPVDHFQTKVVSPQFLIIPQTLFGIGSLFLFISWIWSLSTFCCRCCKFYVILPMFAAGAFVLFLSGIIAYIVMSADELDLPDSNRSLGFSFIIMVAVTIICGVLLFIGAMVSKSPKPHPAVIQPMDTGSYSYNHNIAPPPYVANEKGHQQ